MLPSDKHAGNDNSDLPKGEYLKKLAQMARKELIEETAKRLWLSSCANDHPQSDCHWQRDACYDEMMRRGGNDYRVACRRATEMYRERQKG